MSTKQIFESKYFKAAAIICVIFLIILVSFAAVLKVGSHRAMFSARFGENYERNFLGEQLEKGGRPIPGMEKMMQKGMRNAHGVAGEVLSIADSTLIIKDRDNQENTVRINESTIINRGAETVESNTLVVGEKVVVVGKPQADGVIGAHLIRVFPVAEAKR